MARSVSAASLPQDHEYQRALRAYMATLTENDFIVEIRNFTEPRDAPPAEELFRSWILCSAGWKPAIRGVALPSSQFTLASIEAKDAVMRPGADPAALAWLAAWRHPENIYCGSAEIKRRAFVIAAIDMMMLNALHEQTPRGNVNRSDFLGGTLIWLAYVHGVVRNELPADVRTAYETGLRKFIKRLEEWGPQCEMAGMDLFAAVGLKYAALALADPQVEQTATSYAQRLFTDPRHFHPAGYFVDANAFDASCNGISLYFATWAALLSDWPFAKEAVAKAYRLKNHLTLPEPDGRNYFGPSHFNSRASADSANDQGGWPYRNIGAAMVTEEALYLAPLPPPKVLSQMPGGLVQMLNDQLAGGGAANRPIPWQESHWINSNFAYNHCPTNFHARLTQLATIQPEKFQLPFSRPEKFIRAFDKTFLIAKFDRFGVVIHTGVVSPEPAKGEKPGGFGGGALSAFWTPETGSVILGRRRGMQDEKFDTYNDWRIWPTHAVSGQTADGKVFSSARTESPETEYQLREAGAEVRVAGLIPNRNVAQGVTLQGQISYTRRFAVNADGLDVATVVKPDGRDHLSELYEVIPIFLRDRAAQNESVQAKIQFEANGRWSDATVELRENVTATRVTRFNGAILIKFSEPQRVRLSPEAWQDFSQSRASCRNIMIDLLGISDHPVTLLSAEVQYRIMPLETKSTP
ncbi:MAG: hypothetical protein HY360_08965 [Verrucomicrobia bacterium]|nr:hypothetical protein [Verrucomicrobiota bacterium]